MKRLEDLTEPELALLMRGCGSAVKNYCHGAGVENPLFALLVFNDPAVAQYIANCERSDVIKAMRECADRLERKEDVTR